MGKSSFISASLISTEFGMDLISSLAPGSVSLNLCSSRFSCSVIRPQTIDLIDLNIA